MELFFIHLDGKQLGPLTVDQVKAEGITRETLVWKEGMADWLPAKEISSLATVFATPPPVKTFAATPPPVNPPPPYLTADTEEDEHRIFGLKQIHFYIALAAAVLLVFYIIGATYNNHKDIEVHEEATNTEQNQQLQQQQQQLQEQQAAIEEQNRIEQERLAKEQEAAKQQRIKEFTEEYSTAVSNYYLAMQHLNDVSKFQLLRSGGDRDRQINEANANISLWQEKINTVAAKMRKLGVEPEPY